MTVERIVVGVDGSPGARLAVDWAVTHAAAGATIELVHTWTTPISVAEVGVAIDPMLFAQRAIDVLQAEVEYAQAGAGPGMTITGRTAEGHPGRSLLDAADGAAMVVVGSRGRGGFTGLLLGSTSTYLAHHVACPLVIVPTPR